MNDLQNQGMSFGQRRRENMLTFPKKKFENSNRLRNAVQV
jgi:hypothetical protein